MRLADLYPEHSSLVAAVNYRKVRQLSFEKLDEGLGINSSTIEDSQEEDGGETNDFDSAFHQIVEGDISARRKKVTEVCLKHKEGLSWTEEDLLQHMKHKNLWDVVHNIVFCPIAKVR